MADLSLVTDNYLPTASETFTDNLSGSISALATTVPVNSGVEYATGETVVLTVDPGTANEATFVGKKDTTNQFIECIWTEGNTAVGHDAGATIIDYDSATHYNLLSEALQLIMNQDGTLKDTPIRTALGLSDASNDGWEVFPYTMSVASGYNKGNKEFDITVANQDVRTLLSNGMRLRLERGTTAPTQCFDAESGSTQYGSRASGSLTGTISTMTDDVTTEAWVKPESFTANMTVVGRVTTLGTNGFAMRVLATTGQFAINANAASVLTHQGLSLGKWQHLAVSMDMSGASWLCYLNGVLVPSIVTAGGASFTQSGNLTIGAYAAGLEPFDGKISDVRVWNAIRTAMQIRDNMNQQLVGNETNLVGYWKLNGDFVDSTASVNTLTGSGGAVATNVDNPMVNSEYAIVTNVAFSSPNSTVTVFTGTDHNIPNMSLSSPYYSVQKVPYGFPSNKNKWLVETICRFNGTQTSPVQDQWYNLTATSGTAGGQVLSVPVGAWEYGYFTLGQQTGTTNTIMLTTLSTANNSEVDKDMTDRAGQAGAISSRLGPMGKRKEILVTSQTPYYLNYKTDQASHTNIQSIGTSAPTRIFAECAYV